MWCLINPEGRYVGSTRSYLSAFRIVNELNRELTPERLAMFKEKTRGESYRPHAVAAVRARRFS